MGQTIRNRPVHWYRLPRKIVLTPTGNQWSVVGGQIKERRSADVGRLMQWWNAEDHSEWRWQVEFYNHR